MSEKEELIHNVVEKLKLGMPIKEIADHMHYTIGYIRECCAIAKSRGLITDYDIIKAKNEAKNRNKAEKKVDIQDESKEKDNKIRNGRRKPKSTFENDITKKFIENRRKEFVDGRFDVSNLPMLKQVIIDQGEKYEEIILYCNICMKYGKYDELHKFLELEETNGNLTEEQRSEINTYTKKLNNVLQKRRTQENEK